MSNPRIIKTKPALLRALSELRRRGKTIALVPTMGALHDGHLSLVRLAHRHADHVVVSIFVNPTQFAPHEDFASYPRTLSHDVAKLTPEDVALIWAPNAATMYPDGFSTRITPEGPALAGLEDCFRPHFFGGVATVVGKLFAQVRPEIALFGQKDYQQLLVVTRLAADLDLGVKVIGAPVLREKDGLAMSSRNVYLSAEERVTAPLLYRTLVAAAKRLRGGEAAETVLNDARTALMSAGFAVDYVETRHAVTLTPIAAIKDGPIRLLAAAKVGRTRLIDNVKV